MNVSNQIVVCCLHHITLTTYNNQIRLICWTRLSRTHLFQSLHHVKILQQPGSSFSFTRSRGEKFIHSTQTAVQRVTEQSSQSIQLHTDNRQIEGRKVETTKLRKSENANVRNLFLVPPVLVPSSLSHSPTVLSSNFYQQRRLGLNQVSCLYVQAGLVLSI